MSRKKKHPTKKPTYSAISKPDATLLAEIFAEMKELRVFLSLHSLSAEEAIISHTHALTDACADTIAASDEIDFDDCEGLGLPEARESLRDRAIVLAAIALSLVKEVEPARPACAELASQRRSGAQVSCVSLSHSEAVARLRALASTLGATVEFFSSDDPLPN